MARIIERDAAGKIVKPFLPSEDARQISQERWERAGNTAKIDALGKEGLRQLYWDEHLGQREIAVQLGVNPKTVDNRMRLWDIPTRSAREVQAHITANRPEIRKRMAQATRIANTGRPVSADNLARRAISRQASPNPSKWESALAAALREVGLNPTLACAFGPFSIDLAFPEDKVAVEVGNENHQGAKIRDIDARKSAALHEAGWRLVIVAIPHIKYNVPSAAVMIAGILAEERAIREREGR